MFDLSDLSSTGSKITAPNCDPFLKLTPVDPCVKRSTFIHGILGLILGTLFSVVSKSWFIHPVSKNGIRRDSRVYYDFQQGRTKIMQFDDSNNARLLI